MKKNEYADVEIIGKDKGEKKINKEIMINENKKIPFPIVRFIISFICIISLLFWMIFLVFDEPFDYIVAALLMYFIIKILVRVWQLFKGK